MKSLEEIDRLIVINRNQEKEIDMYKENALVEEITLLKNYLEEAKLGEEALKIQDLEEERHYENLELKIVGLRKDLKKPKALNITFSKGSKTIE